MVAAELAPLDKSGMADIELNGLSLANRDGQHFFVNCIVIDETTMTHGVGETAPLIVASSDVYFGIQGPDNFAAGRTFETAFNACLPDGKPYLGEMSVEYSIGKKL